MLRDHQSMGDNGWAILTRVFEMLVPVFCPWGVRSFRVEGTGIQAIQESRPEPSCRGTAGNERKEGENFQGGSGTGKEGTSSPQNRRASLHLKPLSTDGDGVRQWSLVSLQDGSAVNPLPQGASGPEFNPQNPHKGRCREPTTQSGTLTSTQYICPLPHAHTCTSNEKTILKAHIVETPFLCHDDL